jgi:hypothetical protein
MIVVRAALIVILTALAVAKSVATWARKHDLAIYTRNAGPTLLGLMSRAEELAASKVDLSEEIALLRAVLISVVERWDAAMRVSASTVSADAKRIAEGLQLQCESLIREGAEAVGRLVTTAAKTRLMDQGAMQLSSVSWVVAEVARAVEEEIRDKNPEMADALISRIEQIKLPADGTLAKFTGRAADESFM